MEKSVDYGLEHYMKSIPGMQSVDPKTSSPLVLAYIGDCVFDLIIKLLVMKIVVTMLGKQVLMGYAQYSRVVT